MTRPDESQRERNRGVEEGQLNAVGSGKQPMPPMYTDRRDDHDRDHKRRTDRTQKSESHEQTARDFAQRRCGRESATWTKAKLLEEPTRLFQPVTAKPPEQFLRTVRRHQQADDDPRQQESDAQRL